MDSSGQSELAALGRAVRAVYVHDPEPEVAEGHIAAILAEAERVAAAGADRPMVAPSGRRLGRRASLALRLATVVASAFVASAGLAIAGVRPPEPFSDVFEGLGFDIPGSDQSSGDRDSSGGGPAGSGDGAPAGEYSTDDGGAPGTSASSRASGDVGDRGEARSDQGFAASSGGRETAEQAQSGGAPPSEPGRSEDHPNPPTNPSSQSQLETAGSPGLGEPGGGGPPEQSQSGDDGAEGAEGEEEPEPLVDPPTDTETPDGDGSSPGDGGAPRGLAISAEYRPTDKPDGHWTEPADAG